MGNEILTPELDAFIDKYIEANIDERIEADDPCEHFVDGFVSACKPEDFDELDDEDREIIIDEAFERLGEYRTSLILDDLIGEAIELYEAYHEISGPVEDEPLPEGLIEDEV